MKNQELKKEQFIAKAMENKEKFELHKELIEKHLCLNKFPPVHVKFFEKDLSVEDKMFVEDLKNYAERRVVDNLLLVKLMEYAEEYHEIQNRKMKYENLEPLILEWAKEKRILEKGYPLTQWLKTQEEVQELLKALVNGDKEETIDALGDILVTIIIQAEMQGLSLIDCLESAYNVISKRTCKMVNGQFVKDEKN